MGRSDALFFLEKEFSGIIFPAVLQGVEKLANEDKAVLIQAVRQVKKLPETKIISKELTLSSSSSK